MTEQHDDDKDHEVVIIEQQQQQQQPTETMSVKDGTLDEEEVKQSMVVEPNNYL